VDAGDEVRRALGRLSYDHRVVIVLRCHSKRSDERSAFRRGRRSLEHTGRWIGCGRSRNPHPALPQRGRENDSARMEREKLSCGDAVGEAGCRSGNQGSP
jgi:hypothetical protein